MITCTMTINVKKGYEQEAVQTLSEIERSTQDDPGLISFQWLQNEENPYQFTLFEQWSSQYDLDWHLAKDPGPWQKFTVALDGDPQPGRYRSVAALAAAPSDSEAREFVRTWFDVLSRHVPVEEMLPRLTPVGLEMTFPDSRMTNEAEFRAWYAQVGESFADQTHTLEKVDVRAVPDSADVDVDVVVIWRARQVSDGTSIVARATQAWRLTRSFSTGLPVIATYSVLSLDDLHENQLDHQAG